MRKFLLAVLVLGMATAFASAGIGVLWTVSYGAYSHSAADLTGGSDNLLGSYSAIWQLLYTSNNVKDAIDLGNAANGYVSGDDEVIVTRNIPSGGNSSGGAACADGTRWDEWMLWDISSSPNSYEDLSWTRAGFVFQRVFEGTPAPNSWYYESQTLALNTGFTGGGAPLQDFAIGGTQGGFQPNQQLPSAVPEPATMSLLGLGALVMAIRRRRA